MDEDQAADQERASVEELRRQASELLDEWEVSFLLTTVLSLNGASTRTCLGPSMQRMGHSPSQKAGARRAGGPHLPDWLRGGDVVRRQGSQEAARPDDNSST